MSASKSPLMPVQEALESILARARAVTDTLELPVQEALGRILAHDQVARIDVPAHDNSAMDGYAVNSADLRGNEPLLPVSQSIAAGHPGAPLMAGSAARIFTGAPLPDGADAVVIQEDTRREEDGVRIMQPPAPGENVRRRGHDIARGDRVLSAGHRLRPQDLGLLASLGIPRIPVIRPLTVAIVNTGDEVVAPDRELAAGQIYDSNSYTLAGLLERLGCSVIKLGIVEDSRARTVEALAGAAASADCILTTGGVSVGEADHVRGAVESLGSLDLWKLAIKPGKPFACGQVKGVPLFGLPGNPVAVFVTFAVLVRPFLLKMQGATDTAPSEFRIPAGFAIQRPGGRQEYIRVRLTRNGAGEALLEAFPNQGSSILSSLSWADGLAEIPAGTPVQQGDLVRYLPFDGLI